MCSIPARKLPPRWKTCQHAASPASARLAAAACTMVLLTLICHAQPPQQQQGGVSSADVDALLSLAPLFPGNNWHADTDPCLARWTGVTCANLSLIAGINLHSMGLSGGIPSQIASLSSLISLNLSNNLFEGPIPPELGSLPALQLLDLSGNGLAGLVPPSLGSLLNLQALDLSDNLLNGTIPPSIFLTLQGLRILDLSNNSLDGGIPSDIDKLASITTLDLSHNFLSGPLPPQLGNLPNLRMLNLAGNNFSGSIPLQISFSGTGTAQNYRQAAAIEQLVGTTDSTWPLKSGLGMLKNLATLNLSMNNFSDVIPPELATLPSLKSLDLSRNYLVGPLPGKLGDAWQLTVLRLSSNLIAGGIPNEFGRLVNLSHLDLSSNGLGGRIPQILGTIKSLTTLSLASNQLFGRIPLTLALLNRLTCLNLSSNTLNGPVPAEIGNLTQLLSLDLSSNQFNGSIPEELGDLVNLTNLNLSHNSFSADSGAILSHLPPSLVMVDLSNNGLGGEIPQPIGQLAALRWLNLSGNGLSGGIPQEVGLLPKLQVLDLSHNQLTGDVPSSVWDIAALFLSHNRLRGSIQSTTADVQSNCFRGRFAGRQKDTDDCAGTYHRSSLKLSVAAIVAIVLGVGMFVKIVLFFVWWFHRRNRKRARRRTIIPDVEVKSYLLDELRVATDNFSEKNLLGGGGFGDVYKGTLPDTSLIAVKKLRIFTPQGEKEFLNEVKVISTVHNRNVVPLLGYTVEDGEYILVFPFMSRGSLEDALFRETYPFRLGWTQQASILQGVAQGLAYLHERCVQKIVHRDVKAANILLDESFQAYVADFGLARAMEVEHLQTRTKVAGTIGYIAPEYMRTGQLTEKSDVYSFGILMLVVMSRTSPTEKCGEESHLLKHAYRLALEGQALRLVHPIYHPEFPYNKDQMHMFLSVAFWCLQEEPADRPTMGEIEQMLAGRAPVPLVHLYPQSNDAILEASTSEHQQSQPRGPADTSSETSIRVAPSPSGIWSQSE